MFCSKIIHPWLGLRYTSLQTVPLEILEPIYQKFPDVEKGLYISNVCALLFLFYLPCFILLLLGSKSYSLKILSWKASHDCIF